MIRRILYAVVGCAAAAVMISAATRAVDFEQSSIEDDNVRFVIAAVGAVVFLGCLYLLVADLAQARASAAASDGEEDEPTAAPNKSSLADRFAAARTTEPVAGSGGPPRSPIVVTQPSATSSAPPDGATDRPRSVTSSGTGLFGVVTPSTTRASTADGLFGRRTPNRPAATVDQPEGVPTSPPTLTTDPGPARPPATAMGVPTTPPEPTRAAPTHEPDAPAPPAPPAATTPPAVASEPTMPVTPAASAEPTPATEPMAPPAPAAASEPIALRDYDPDHIDRTIEAHDRAAVDALVASGTRRNDGPPTAEDLRTMLFIGLSAEQRRAILHEARAEEPVPVDRTIGVGTPHPDDAHPDDALPQWHVIDDLDDSAEDAAPHDDIDPEDGVDGDDEPPSTGYLYVTGGN